MVEHASLNPTELRDAIRELLSTESDSRAVRRSIAGDATVRSHLWSRMAELGWFGIAVDPESGGLGLGFTELTVLHEELGRHLTPVGVGQTLLAAEALKLGDNAGLRAKWLPLIATGEASATIGLPTVNGVLSASAGEPRLSGGLDHVLEADTAQLLLLPVIDGNGNQALAAIERGTDGLTVLRRSSIDQTRSLSTITLLNVPVSVAQMLHLESRGLSALLDHASVAIACDAIGGAARILEETVAYMKTRVQFGRPIGSFQALKARAANWKILLEAAMALTGRAVEMVASGDAECSRWASDAKFYACDCYAAIAGDAIQLHGGIGFTWEHDCHLFFKRAKLNQVLYGSSVQHKERSAAFLLGTGDLQRRRAPAVKSLNRVETSR